jgi:phospholipid-translocating ATPase
MSDEESLTGQAANGKEAEEMQTSSKWVYPRHIGRYPRVTTEMSFTSNYVSTTKYTLLNFFPLSLLSQFRRLANVYFLIIAVMQSIPAISPLTPITAIAPLVCVVFLSMARDGIENYNRYLSDKVVNGRKVDVFDEEQGKLKRRMWEDVRVGDLIRVHDRESIPADLLLLSSNHGDGSCHLDTMNLDGETNLKRKVPQQATVTFQNMHDEELRSVLQQVMLECEEPTESLHRFNGNLHLGDDVILPVDENQLLLRGATLRNTNWVLGLAVYTGNDTKEMLGAKDSKFKRSNIEVQVNELILLVFGFQVVLAFIAGIIGGLWVTDVGKDHFYLACDDYYDCSGEVVGILEFLTYIVLLNTLIPISLIVTMEFVKVFQALLIQKDQQMMYYQQEVVSALDDIDDNDDNVEIDEFGNPIMNTTRFETVEKGASVRSVTLNEELGQIQHIFSDKTGTLTENKMEFSLCTVAGSVYGIEQLPHMTAATSSKLGAVERMAELGRRASENPGGAEEMFLISLLVCHSIIIETNPDGSLSFNADSPDEVALVKGAELAGYRLLDRKGEYVELDLNGIICSYEVLQVIPFSSARKRMTVIARRVPREMEEREGVQYDIVVFTKGADSVILERCDKRWLSMPHNHLGTRMQQFYNFCRRKAIRTGESKRQSRKQEEEEDEDDDDWTSFSKMIPIFKLNEQGHVEEDAGITPSSHLYSPEIEVLINEHGLASEPLASMDDISNRHLDLFASLGLRTLCFGYRVLTPSFFRVWEHKVREAELLTPKERATEFGKLATEIEVGLTLVASTAIEDKLQDDVPITIQRLLRANIKMWVLTGDKLETAVEISKSCGLVTPSTEIHVLERMTSEASAATKLGSILGAVRRSPDVPHTVVVDGVSLSHIIEVDKETREIMIQSNSDTFVSITSLCKTVVICRCSPAQKAQVVDLIKLYNPDIITLAVGDGANDVAMIRAANIGVGIAGQEGMQAVRSSDYAVQQFRDLDPLLLFHGRLAYSRLSKMITYFFFKNFAFTIPLWLFGAYCAWSGQTFYDDIYITLYNTIFTLLPPFVFALLEQEVRRNVAFHLPELYRVSQWNFYFRPSTLLYWFSIAFVQSCLFILIPIYSGPYNVDNPDGFWVVSVASFTCVIFSVTFQIMVNTNHWDKVTLSFYLLSFVLFFGFTYAYDTVTTAKVSGALLKVFESNAFWFLLLLMVTIVILMHLFVVWLWRLFAPENWVFENKIDSLLLPPISPIEVVQRMTEEQAKEISNKVQTVRFGEVIERMPSKSNLFEVNNPIAGDESSFEIEQI